MILTTQQLILDEVFVSYGKVILAFLLGLIVIHDLTRPPLPGENMDEPRALLTSLLPPVRLESSASCHRAILLTSGFWASSAVSDLARLAEAWRTGRLQAALRGWSSWAPRLLAARVVASRIAPLFAAYLFLRWRARAISNNVKQGANPGEGLGTVWSIFPILSCTSLPLVFNVVFLIFSPRIRVS